MNTTADSMRTRPLRHGLALAAVLLAGSVTVSVHAAAAADTMQPAPERKGPWRLPEIRTAADIDAMVDMTPAEKQLAVENLTRIPNTNGWHLLESDPELAASWYIMESQIAALLPGEYQGIPFSPLNLISLVVAKEQGNDYVYSLFAAATIKQFDNSKVPFDAAAKFAVIDQPESKLWTDDQRLVITFTRAALKNQMTDALYNQAHAAWGTKRMLRYLSWLSYQFMWTTVANVTDMKFMPSMVSATAKPIPPEQLKRMFDHHEQERQGFMALIKATGAYPTGR